MDKSRNRTTKRRKPGDKPTDTEPEIVEELPDESTEAKNSKLQCRPKTVRERKNAVKTPQPGLAIQKVDTFAVSLQKKAPKTEPVAPSYPPGTLGNLLVKTSRVRQFLGGPATKNGPGAKTCGQNTPTGS